MSTVVVFGLAVLFLFVFAIWPIFVAREIMGRKGRSKATGVVLGVLFGWVGVLVTLALRPASS